MGAAPILTGRMTQREGISVHFCSPFLSLLSGCAPPLMDTTSCLAMTSKARGLKAMGYELQNHMQKKEQQKKKKSFLLKLIVSGLLLQPWKDQQYTCLFSVCDSKTPVCIKLVNYS